MAGTTRKSEQRFSYADYLTWNDDKRCEIIDGIVYDMTGPSYDHQSISGELFRQLANYFTEKPCEVFSAPFDVLLAKKTKKDKEIFNVVQPDIMVVCDKNKITDRGVFGAPDLIIEIISPSTASRDNILKRSLYEKSGVKEFWLLHPGDRLIRVSKLGKDGFFGRDDVYDSEAKIEIELFPGLIVDCRKVFPKIPKVPLVKTPPAARYEY